MGITQDFRKHNITLVLGISTNQFRIRSKPFSRSNFSIELVFVLSIVHRRTKPSNQFKIRVMELVKEKLKLQTQVDEYNLAIFLTVLKGDFDFSSLFVVPSQPLSMLGPPQPILVLREIPKSQNKLHRDKYVRKDRYVIQLVPSEIQNPFRFQIMD